MEKYQPLIKKLQISSKQFRSIKKVTFPLMDEMEKLTKQKEEFEENKAKHNLFLNGLQSSTVDIDLIREKFGNLPDLMDNDDKSDIISTLIAQVLLKISKGSNKGEIITKVRNQPD